MGKLRTHCVYSTVYLKFGFKVGNCWKVDRSNTEIFQKGFLTYTERVSLLLKKKKKKANPNSSLNTASACRK